MKPKHPNKAAINRRSQFLAGYTPSLKATNAAVHRMRVQIRMSPIDPTDQEHLIAVLESTHKTFVAAWTRLSHDRITHMARIGKKPKAS